MSDRVLIIDNGLCNSCHYWNKKSLLAYEGICENKKSIHYKTKRLSTSTCSKYEEE